jgi:phosphate transport system permease protein
MTTIIETRKTELPVATVLLPAAPQTTVINRANDPAPETPTPEIRRQTGGLRMIDLLSALGAAIASLSLTALLTTQLAPISGPIAFGVIAYLLFVGIYALLVSLDESGPAVRDRIVLVIVHSLAFVLLLTLVFVVVFTVGRGLQALPHLNFFTQDMSLAGPLDPLSDGGVIHAIAGTLIQIAIALAITIPLGLTTALFLSEVPGPFARFVRTIVEAMTALPSIVAGLFVYATFILILGVEKSGFAASLAISVMMLPIMIRASDVVIRLVPSTLKEASIGLGAGQWRTVWHVVLPTSRSGLTTAIILATARGIGETSPVLLTAGFTASLNLDPFHGPMISLPLAVFEFVKSPEPTMIARGFGTAAVLMLLVLILFVIARIIGGETLARREKRRERIIALRSKFTLAWLLENPVVARARSNRFTPIENEHNPFAALPPSEPEDS